MELDKIYLRSVVGELIGPLDAKTLTALLQTKVIDDATPASLDGRSFVALQSLTNARAAPPDTMTIDLGTTVLRGILARAVERATGRVRIHAAEGEIFVLLKEGKVLGLETTIAKLSFSAFLESRAIVSARALTVANAKASTSQEDLGSVLISTGALQPQAYMEALVAWAMDLLATALLEQHKSTFFDLVDVRPPIVPLALDQFAVYLDAVRSGTHRQELDEYIRPHLSSPVVMSTVDGVTLQEFRLKPRELRVLNSVNGVRTVEEILKEVGTSPESSLTVLQVLFFAEQAGFFVYGQDPRIEAERDEARRLKTILADLQAMNPMQIFGATAKSTDEDVRAKYAELAKRYHPDRVRQGALQELVDLHRAIFALVSEAFSTVEKEEMRAQYAQDVEQGLTGGTADLRRVQDVLRAETFFKKTEILVRVRKYDEALDHLLQAVQLNPQDVEFKMFLPYVEYFAKTKGKRDPELAKSALKQIAPLAEKNPVANGHLWMGHLHKQASNLEAALRCFGRVLELDPQQPEALQEVRLAEARKAKAKK